METNTKRNLKEIIRTLPDYDPYAQSDGFTFDESKAQHAIDFIEECLTFTAGEKGTQPFILETWQVAIVANAYGWRDVKGNRRFNEIFILVAKKNGKSELGGALETYELFCGSEHGRQVYSAASVEKQAALSFKVAKEMINKSPVLCDMADVNEFAVKIKQDNSFMRTVVNETKSTDGINPSFVLVDELHRIDKSEFVHLLQSSFGARRDYAICYITTSDYDRESVYNEIYKRAKAVQANKGNKSEVGYNPRFLPCIYECQPEEWQDKTKWVKANPNLGVSVSMEYLEQLYQQAMETPSYLNDFKRLFLNIRTATNYAWLDIDDWNKCPDKIDAKALVGEPCNLHIDLGLKDDLAAVILWFGRQKACLAWFWCPERVAIERTRKDRVNYEVWVRQGFLTATKADDGRTIDFSFIFEQIIEICKIYNPSVITYDPWHATQLSMQLVEQGLNVKPFAQTQQNMNEPTILLELMVKKHELNHGGNPVLKWMAGNASIFRDAKGNVAVSKTSSKEKVDGLIALICAVGYWMTTEKPFVSSYETERLTIIDTAPVRETILTVKESEPVIERVKAKNTYTDWFDGVIDDEFI